MVGPQGGWARGTGGGGGGVARETGSGVGDRGVT